MQGGALCSVGLRFMLFKCLPVFFLPLALCLLLLHLHLLSSFLCGESETLLCPVSRQGQTTAVTAHRQKERERRGGMTGTGRGHPYVCPEYTDSNRQLQWHQL